MIVSLIQYLKCNTNRPLASPGTTPIGNAHTPEMEAYVSLSIKFVLLIQLQFANSERVVTNQGSFQQIEYQQLPNHGHDVLSQRHESDDTKHEAPKQHEVRPAV